MGTLYLVATPIGNLEDITLRALRILKEVDLIAAEDTRHTRGLLTHYEIKTPLTSYFEHNKTQKIEPILNALAEGDVAVVSDAGTPTINDPGIELIREAIKAGHTVTPIPGPSSPIAALSACGLATHAFLFLGYMPRKKSEREANFKELAKASYTLVYLESPNRVIETLKSIAEIFPERQVVIAREITKKFEEFIRGSADEILAGMKDNPRGEIVLIIEGYAGKIVGEKSIEDLDGVIKERLDHAEPVKSIANALAKEFGLEKKKIYQRVLDVKDQLREK